MTSLTSASKSKTPSCEGGRSMVSNFTSRNLPLLLDLVATKPLHVAMMPAVAKVDDHAESQPDEQAHPCGQGKCGHQGERNHDAEDRDQRYQRSSEWAMQVRTPFAQNPYARAHDDERQQRTNAYQFAENPNRHHRSEYRHEKSHGNRRNVRRAEPGMHLASPLRQQAIARHGVEHPRLSQQHHQHHASQPGNGAEVKK